ncbi:MAG: tetratricopeptide repeat protein [Bdellovibrionaceae bacterium]|nr:tetratricopeptide repeat protein [Pseudobdellovibrionaceae bacterium]
MKKFNIPKNEMHFFIISILFSVAFLSQVRAESRVKGKISYQDETIHLEFSGKENWQYDLQTKADKKNYSIDILIDPMDQETIKSFLSFKSNFIQKVEINEKAENNKTLIRLLLKEALESFDYLVENPSRLVIDLYQKTPTASPAKNSAEPLKTRDLKAKALNKAEQKNSKEISSIRKPATADFMEISSSGSTSGEIKNSKNTFAGIYDGADPFYERFTLKDYEIKEEAIILSKENYYIPYPDLDLPVEEWNKVKKAESVFEVIPKDTPENKHVRLLQTLLDNKRYQVFFKTYDWFMEKYPESEYLDLVKNMKIKIHIEEWKNKNQVHDYDIATQMMRETVEKNPQHPMSERYSLLLGIYAFDKKDYFNSLRLFQNHNKQELWNKKGSFSADLASLGVALSYLKLKQFDESYKSLEKLEQATIYDDIKAEACYRKGDVKFNERKFDNAINEYKAAIKKYPKSEYSFPNAYYNQAQAEFLLEEYKESLNTYRDFIKKFPQDKFTPFAMTRVGELLEILGADKTKVVGAYLETNFRNGDNPYAIVAKLRLMTAKMKGMKEKEVQSTVKEIADLAKKSELSGIQQFATVLIAEGYQQRKDFDKALNLLIDYYKANPTIVDRNLFSKRIVSNIYDKIESAVDKGNFLEGLKIYNSYFDNWLKPSTRMDIKYQVGKAYEQGGVFEPAIKYYNEVLNKIYSYKGSKEGKERLLKEKLPPESLLNLRLAAVENENKNYKKAFEYLKAIKDPHQLSEAQQIERVLLATALNERRGDLETAELYLTELLKYWSGKPELIAEPYLKLSELELKQNKKNQALKSLEKIDQLMEDTKLVNFDIHKKALEKLAKLNDDDKNYDVALLWYEKLLENYEDKIPLASARYRVGQIYFDIGKIQKASEVWSSFKGENSDIWKKMSKEQLRSHEWQNENKKFINRMPSSTAKP